MDRFYALTLAMHGYWRWAVLVALIGAIFVAVLGLMKRRPFVPLGRVTAVLAIATLDIQFLIGLVLYGISPLIRVALGNMAVAMKDRELRFFTVEHLAGMVLAIAVAHVGFALAKRAKDDATKYRHIFIFYAISLAIILGSIPWWRPLLPVISR